MLILNTREGILVRHVDGGTDGSLEFEFSSLGLIDVLQSYYDMLRIFLRADDDKVYILRSAVEKIDSPSLRSAFWSQRSTVGTYAVLE